MSLLIDNCPRCGAYKITFDVSGYVFRYTEYEWKHWFEIFSVCRSCQCPTIFLISLNEPMGRNQASDVAALLGRDATVLNGYFEVNRFISLRDNTTQKPPEHLPEDIQKAFDEGAACLSIGCNNAASTMFRLCVDLVTQPLLPNPTDTTINQPNSKTRRDLGLRLTWMFENEILPST